MSPPYGNAGGHIIEDTPCAFFFSLQQAITPMQSVLTSKARAATQIETWLPGEGDATSAGFTPAGGIHIRRSKLFVR